MGLDYKNVDAVTNKQEKPGKRRTMSRNVRTGVAWISKAGYPTMLQASNSGINGRIKQLGPLGY